MTKIATLFLAFVFAQLWGGAISFLLLFSTLLCLPFVLGAFDSGSSEEENPPEDPEPPIPDPPMPPIGPIDFFGINGPDEVEGGALNDTLRGFNGDDDLRGQGGDDELNGGNGFDTLFGDDGNDTLSGNGGGDLMGGGAGDDLLFAGGSEDNVDGGNGNDTLYGGNGEDSLFGDESPRIGTGDEANGNDLLFGGNGADLLAGNGGLDTLNGGAGNDRIFDYDLARFDGPNASLVDGGDGNDTILVDGGSTITGGSGEDQIAVYASLIDPAVTEITDFSPGEDTLEIDLEVGPGDSGALTLVDFSDGTGAEIYYADTLIARVTGAQGLGPDDIDLRLVLEQDSGSYAFEDGAGSSTIIGNDADNTIRGGAGDDTIIAGGFYNIGGNFHSGNDLLEGGAGDDFISAAGGSLDVFGDADLPETLFFHEVHPDTLIGGEGDDTLLAENGGQITGGSGADLFGVSQDIGDAALGYPYDPVVITDFDSDADTLFVDVRPQYLADGNGTISVAVWEDGTGSDVLLDGVVIAQVTGGQNLTPNAIVTDDSIIFE